MNKDSYGRVSWDDLSLPPKINAVPLRENKPLKVYQIEETIGEYEDTQHIIKGTYLHKQRALAELERLKQKVKEDYRCMDCPYSWERPDKPLKVDCPTHEPIYENAGLKKYGVIPEYSCENLEDSYDAPSYRLFEFDVDESED